MRRLIGVMVLLCASVAAWAQAGKTQFTFADTWTLRGFMLLHELGHQMGVFGADINAAFNGANSQAVLDHCFNRDAQGIYH